MQIAETVYRTIFIYPFNCLGMVHSGIMIANRTRSDEDCWKKTDTTKNK